MTFSDMGLRPETLAVLARMDVVEPTPIQAAATPELLAGRDVIGQARTGSGKTLAFAAPLVERCDARIAAVQGLVLVPTRELALQVGEVLDQLAAAYGLRCAFLYGGRDVGDQQVLLTTGPQIVVGTPGRLLDLLYRGNLRLNQLRFLVIDEADEMLDEGFGPDVEQVLDCILHKPQVALFSATIPAWVEAIAQHRLSEPVMIRVDVGRQPIETVAHVAIEVPAQHKFAALCELVGGPDAGSVVVFCRTKTGVERLGGQLGQAGYSVLALQGNLTQRERERIMRSFRDGRARILVATNVAARGLDVARVRRVINYDLPDSPELLTHRLGRTGRMGRAGEAITLVTAADQRRWASMQRALGIAVDYQRWVPGSSRAGGEPAASTSSRDGGSVRRPQRNMVERAASPATSSSAPLGPGGTGLPEACPPPHSARRSRPTRPGSRGTPRTQRVDCEGCGVPTEVPYEPTPARPAYCRECRELVSTAR